MVSATIVTAFNGMARCLQAAGHQGPQLADGLKTLVIKPLILPGSTLNFFGRNGRHPDVMWLTDKARWVKDLISASEVLTKLPRLLNEFSDPITVKQSIGRKFWWKNREAFTQGRAFIITDGEAVAHRIFNLASWCLNVSDTIDIIERYRPLHKLCGRVTPWIGVVASGYMGVQSAYIEVRFQQRHAKILAPAEKYLGALNLATSMNDCFLSASSFLGLYYKGSGPAWLAKLHFTLTIGATILPVVQRCAQAWVEKNGKPDPTKTGPKERAQL